MLQWARTHVSSSSLAGIKRSSFFPLHPNWKDTLTREIPSSDTTAAALANTFYFLAKNPPVLRKLQGYLDKLCPNGVRDWSYAKMKFPYLDHIINETLRLKPPVPSGLPRITPPEGIQIDEVYIPGDTIVAVPTHTIQRDERYYERPLDFDPERWERISPEKSAFIPFTRGM